MRVLLIPPNRNPISVDIPDSLSAKQRLVGGPIDVLDCWEDGVVAVLNDEGKNMGLPKCRRIEGIEIAGSFFLCSRDINGNLCSLEDEQIHQYSEMFAISRNHGYLS